MAFRGLPPASASTVTLVAEGATTAAPIKVTFGPTEPENAATGDVWVNTA